MKKTYILVFSISVLSLFTISVIMLMLMTPQQTTLMGSQMPKYDSIVKTDYTFTQTKDITNEVLVHEYSITKDDVKKFENNTDVKPGNSNPFTPPADVPTDNPDNGNNTDDNINNSNGGKPNPPSTNK